MAKKKGKGASKAAPASESTSPTTAVEAESNAAQTVDAPSPEPSTAEVAPVVEAAPQPVASTTSSSSQVDVEELARELAACKARIADLESRNKVLSEENQRLKSSQGASQAPALDAVRAPDVDALAQRIAHLKAEQAEADAAREAAWAQLKSVVADIARLAAPEGTAKVGTPTSAAAAAFGAAATAAYGAAA